MNESPRITNNEQRVSEDSFGDQNLGESNEL
jgi:hypothetical protein